MELWPVRHRECPIVLSFSLPSFLFLLPGSPWGRGNSVWHKVILRFRNLKPILNKVQEELKEDFWVNRNMTGTKRKHVREGMLVKVVRKEDQRSGKLTEGVVKDVLTSSAVHPHGIQGAPVQRSGGPSERGSPRTPLKRASAGSS